MAEYQRVAPSSWHRRSEGLKAPSGQGVQVAGGADAIGGDRDRSLPVQRVQRRSSGLQHRRPGAFQQVTDLLTGRTGRDDQLCAARSQVPQPRPDRIGSFGLIAAQLGDQPGDDRRVGVVVLVAGEVLGFPSSSDQQRLHAHQPHPVLSGQLIQDTPAVSGGLAGHHHRIESGLAGLGQTPPDHLAQPPRLRA
ncbi:MAG TPA: hypothetical protein VGH89_21215 [Pseudonocardia sp.]